MILKTTHGISAKGITIKRVYNRTGSRDEKGKEIVPTKDGRATVQIEILKDGLRKYFDTGVRLLPEQWNKAKAEPTAKDMDRQRNIRKIGDLEARLKAIENIFIAEGKAYTVRDFDLTERKEYTDLIEFWKDELSKEKLKSRTIQATNTSLATLVEYQSGKRLHFRDITRKFLDDYRQYLLQPTDDRAGYNPNTVKSKLFKHLKKYTTRAIQHKLMKYEDNPFIGYKMQSVPTNRPYLTVSEINKIEALKFKKSDLAVVAEYTQKPTTLQSLEAVRDFFLFQCYTGLRYGDIKQITDKNIIEDEQKRLSLVIDKSDKTDKPIQLSLYLMFPVQGAQSKPEQILQRNRKPKQFRTFGDSSEQHINRTLKGIAALASINKNLTTHVGRHSFITRMIYLVPLHTIQKLVQHSDIKTTMKYVHIGTKEIDENLMRVKDWGMG
jgi:site-specific recombinase XerD